MNDPAQFDAENFPGLHNRAIRYWYYLNQGLGIVNAFRNLFLGILALYYVLKLDNWILLVVMFIPTVIVLTVVGYYMTHHMNKRLDWLSVRFGTYYSIRQYKLQEGIHDALQELVKNQVHIRETKK